MGNKPSESTLITSSNILEHPVREMLTSAFFDFSVSFMIQDYRTTLSDALTQRRLRNPGYSLRAFARDLGISPSYMSEVLSQRENLSPKYASKLADSLGMQDHEKVFFVTSVEAKHARSPEARKTASAKLTKIKKKIQFETLQGKQYDQITNWFHFSILELLRYGKDKCGNCLVENWIAEQLGVQPFDAECGLRRLRLAGLIRKRNNWFEPVADNVETTNNVPSSVIRAFHEQLIQKGAIAVQTQPVDERAYSSLVLAFKKNRINEAANDIREFCKTFNEKYSSDIKELDSVYCLAAQFFQITKSIGQKEK